MSRMLADTVRGEVVQRPREGDALGAVLRGAYVRDCDLPEELATLLRQLNGNGGMRATTLDRPRG